MRWSGWRVLGLRLAVLAGLSAVALGLAADGIGRASSTPWRLGRPDATTVGVVALSAFGVGALLLVLGLVLRRGQPVSLRRRSPWTGLVLVVLAIALALLLDRRPGREATEAPAEEPLPTPSPGVDASTGSEGGSVALLALLALACVVVALLAARRRRAEPVVAPVAVDTAVAEGLVAAADSLRTSTGDAPRDRIIGAYAAFEATLADRGLCRGPAATPAGVLAAVVASGAPAGPAARLTELFTAARFGTARMSAADVAAAEQALDDLLVVR